MAGFVILAAATATVVYLVTGLPPAEPSYLFDPESLAIGGDGRLYVGDEDRNAIVVLDPEGEVLLDVGKEHWARRPLGEDFHTPDGLAFLPDGRLVVLDGRGRILVCSADLARVDVVFGEPGPEPGQLDGPEGVAVDASGRIFETDEDQRRVQVFSAEGTYLGGFSCPHEPEGIACSPDGERVAVTFPKADVVSLYSVDGDPAREAPDVPGATELARWSSWMDDGFDEPEAVAFSPDGTEIYVTDAESGRVLVFDGSGSFVRSFGGFGTAPGRVRSLDDLAFDPEGRLVVCDPEGRVLHVFQPDGTFVRTIRPTPDLAGRLYSP